MKSKGITLIALVITIIIMMIIVAVTVATSIGNDGILFHSRKSSFYAEMSQLEDEKQAYMLDKTAQKYTQQTENQKEFLGNNLTENELMKLSDTLKAEIIYMRSSPGTEIETKAVWKNNLYKCNEFFTEENLSDTTKNNLTKTIYYLAKSTDYIYDEGTETIYKVKDTKLGKHIVHSLVYARLMIDGIGFNGLGMVNMNVEAKTASDGTIFYEPNLCNFTYKTTVIYYSKDMTTYEVNVRDYINGGKKNTIEVEGVTYTFANYVNTKNEAKSDEDITIWGNIKCTANNLETNWVWIPRYAYKLDETAQTTDVIFIDLNDKPLDKEKYGEELPEGYTPHESFAQDDGLYGIWFSKYEPSYAEGAIDSTEPNAPDMSNFSADNTKLIYYNPEDLTDIVERPYSQNPAQTYTQGETTYYFYKYEDKIWANVKCIANNLETNWVWIPRYAYVLGSSENTLSVGLHEGNSNIIFIDENDKPIDSKKWGTKLPSEYTVHEAFNQDGNMNGIWFSKYEPSKVE